MLDKKKNTAIHYAAIYGHYQSIKLLRQNGADINAQNSLGFTPIMGQRMISQSLNYQILILEAVANGHELAVQLLLKEGANADVRNFKNVSDFQFIGFEIFLLAFLHGHRSSERIQ